MTAIGIGISPAFGGGGFSPFAIGQPTLIYDGNKGITLNGADVSNWADQSGNGDDLSQGTPANQLVYNLSDSDFNNQGSVEGDGVSEYLQTSVSAFTVSLPYTVILVYKAEALGATNMLVDSRSGGVNLASFWASPANAINIYAGTTQAIGTLDLNPHIRVIVFNGASTQSWEDGIASHPAGSPGTNVPIDLRVFANAAGSAFGNSKSPHLTVYDFETSADQLNYLCNGLAARFGTTWTNI